MQIDHYNQFNNYLCHSQINTTKYNSVYQQQQSIVKLPLNSLNSTYQYNAHDHTIIVRATKNSKACQQLQTLLNNQNTLLDQLIDSQFILTCYKDNRSVCILIDDDKQSEQYRSSFLHYIYRTLSNTLKKTLENDSIQLTCMNLAYFNNSLCDIINMQRLRLIDTGI